MTAIDQRKYKGALMKIFQLLKYINIEHCMANLLDTAHTFQFYFNYFSN